MGRARLPRQPRESDNEGEHTAKVDLGSSPKYVGNTVDLRVHGDTAVDAMPAWLGYVTGAVGVLLVSAGIIGAIRTRHPPNAHHQPEDAAPARRD
jgi:hypothetical protein